ncbi:MAG TPA: amino acid permease, partial [Usitatibacteraceae bacterium]|nr:amino acid permease [Usitatibacteraceae bacterium]
MSSLFRVKPLSRLIDEMEHGEFRLKRSLGRWQLTSLGIGAIIGAGIFSTVGTAAAGGADHLGAGPALVVSFMLTAVACGFAALCYAEFASMVPVAGSAYTYAYATLGELVAWIIGWDLIIEYAVGDVAVAISWSGYFQELLRNMGTGFPAWLGTDYRSAAMATRDVADAVSKGVDPATLGPAIALAAQALTDAPRVAGIPIVFNFPAFLIVMGITWVLVRGIKESAWLTTATTALNIAIIGFFCIVGFFYTKSANWVP